MLRTDKIYFFIYLDLTIPKLIIRTLALIGFPLTR